MDIYGTNPSANIYKWNNMLTAQKSSGLNVKDFCQQHDIKIHAFYQRARVVSQALHINTHTTNRGRKRSSQNVVDDWWEMLNEQMHSGMPATKWCALNGISYSTFLSRKKKILSSF